MSDGELIQDIKLRRIRQMDSMTETQVRPPKPSRRTPIPSDWSDDDDGKDDQARAPIAKPILQDPKPSTSFGAYASQTLRRPNTYPKASGTMTMHCGCRIHLNQTPQVREPAVGVVPPSLDRIIHNECVQISDELPVPVRPRQPLANWTSVRLGNNPKRPTTNERETEHSTYNSVIDTNRQQNRESEQQDSELDDVQSTDPDLMYSDYRSEHLEDLG